VRIGFIEDTHLHGGTQIWVTEATRAFLERGKEVTVITPSESWVAQHCEEAGAQIAGYDWDTVVEERAADQATWTEALRDCDVAVCTVHPPRKGFHCSVFAAKCIQEAGLETHLIPKSGTIVPEYLREFYLPNERIHSSVIAIADFTRRYLIETYKIPAEKVALIYQGTEVQRFRSTSEGKAEALKRYPLPEKAAPILASVGSFEHRKGHPVLFEALARLVGGPLPHAHLMMVGDGPDETMLKEMVKRMGLEDHVAFFPFTNEPRYAFERIDATVLPSLYKEGLPNVLLESMAMDVPVVASDLGGVGEIVEDGETGYKVEPGDVQALAEAIAKLWENQEAYARMRAKVRQLVVEKFDKEKQFDRFLEHFKTVTGNR
jgi:glycosyltransferase involved in cell wall biosynthesis